MKRSEMLTLIREKLLDTFIDHENFEDQILSTVEELGMLPPHTVIIGGYQNGEIGHYWDEE